MVPNWRAASVVRARSAQGQDSAGAPLQCHGAGALSGSRENQPLHSTRAFTRLDEAHPLRDALPDPLPSSEPPLQTHLEQR